MTMLKDAVMSADGVYRYSLTRAWDALLPPVVWVMLNPSTADAEQDDPTIRKCLAYAKRWGYGSIRVLNLFALRATEPEVVKLALDRGIDAVGPLNHFALGSVATLSHPACRIICAWGAKPWAKERAEVVLAQLHRRPLNALALTKDGSPAHPLYQRLDVCPLPFPS